LLLTLSLAEVNLVKELARRKPQLLHLPRVNLSVLLEINFLHLGHLIFFVVIEVQ